MMMFGSDEDREEGGGERGREGEEGGGLESPPLSLWSDDDFSNIDQAMMIPAFLSRNIEAEVNICAEAKGKEGATGIER